MTINLLASGVGLVELAEAMAVEFAMASLAASEVLFLEPMEPDGVREAIALTGLTGGAGLTLRELVGDEIVRFVEFARMVDDGEAATIALAIGRGVDLATDDRKGRSLARSLGVRTVGTATIVRTWQESRDGRRDRVGRALAAIERRAHYRPAADDPDLAWWEECCRRDR